MTDRQALGAQSTSRAVRVFTAEDVEIIVEFFGGNADRFRQLIDAADHDVLNVGMECEWDDDEGHNSMRRLIGPWVEKPVLEGGSDVD